VTLFDISERITCGSTVNPRSFLSAMLVFPYCRKLKTVVLE
jgi:hypothetical protein